MKSPEKPVALPLDYAAELAFEMHLMRGECGDVARELTSQSQPDELALEECAQLDDALARAQVLLHAALKRIKASRAKRQNRDT